MIEWILMPINVVVVFAKDWRKRGFKNALIGISNYFKESAIRKDIYLCGEYRSLWNATLKTWRALRLETTKKEIENAGKVLKYYREMIEDLGNKLKTAILELDEAKALIKELEDKVELLTDELKKYKQLNRKKES